MKKIPGLFSAVIVLFLTAVVNTSPQQSPQQSIFGADLDRDPAQESGRRLFEKETFGGNGRTCRTCHTEETGTLSPEDVKRRFREDRHDPLFVHDGSDDGLGHGTKRTGKTPPSWSRCRWRRT